MSPKVQAYLWLIVSIVADAGNVSALLLNAGFPVAAHVAALLVSVAAKVMVARSDAILKGKTVPLVGMTLTLCLACVAWLSAYQAACTPGESQSPAVAPVVNFAVCVLGVSAEDAVAGKTAEQIVEDAIAKCGGDAVAVGQVLDAHKNAEIREGCVSAAKAK